MTVEQDGAVVAQPMRSGNVEQQARRFTFDCNDFYRQTVDRLLTAPLFSSLDHRTQVPMRIPARIERRRLCRHAHVIDELRDELFIPLRSDELIQISEIHGSSGRGVKGKVYGC